MWLAQARSIQLRWGVVGSVVMWLAKGKVYVVCSVVLWLAQWNVVVVYSGGI
jgi:hypothetical protein